jgi:hypothetical protein
MLLALTGPSSDGASPANSALEADHADQDSFAEPPNGEAPEGRLPHGLQELPHDNTTDADVEPLFRATADRPTPPTGERLRWQTGLARDGKNRKGVATTELVGTVGVRNGAAIGAARPSRCGRRATRLAALVMPRQSRVSRLPNRVIRRRRGVSAMRLALAPVLAGLALTALGFATLFGSMGGGHPLDAS